MRPALAALAALLLALPAAAQVPDSTAAAPADSLAPPVAARGAVAPFDGPPGPALTPVPAPTAALDLEGLLAEGDPAVAVFGYALGAPGRTAGLSLDGLAPLAPSLALDGRPVDDLFTGGPRVDLLPLGIVGPLHRHPMRGRAEGLAAGLRDVRAGVPVTELRYLGGQDGVQHVTGTHAQTRRPPAFLRGGSDASRLTVTGHAATRSADDDAPGGDVSHTDALARVLLTRPGVAVEAGLLYADRSVGARAGLVPAGDFPVEALFDPNAARVVGGGATRRDLRTEGWLRVRAPLFGDPTEAGVAATVQRVVFADGAGDTLRVHGRRLHAFVEQPVALPGHALALRVEATAEPAPGPGGRTEALPAAEGRTGLHATARDVVRLGPVEAEVGGGLHRVASEAWPSASARVAAGPLSAGVRYGGRAASWLETVGLAGRVTPQAGPGERTLAVEAALEGRLGTVRLGVRAFASRTTDARALVSLGDTAALSVVAVPVRQGGASASLAWRADADRGLYLRLGGTARAVLAAETDVLDRLDAALPRAWGAGRLGLRAEDVGERDVLDLDLAVTARGWTAFRSRRADPATGALLLPEPGAALGFELPARALVGLEATATFSARASLFVRYDHALGERAYGAVVTQGEPLPPHVLRFGVFWALLD